MQRTYQLPVHRTETGWVVDMLDAPDANKIQDLFGTTTLPTAFTYAAPFETVKRSLEALNRGAQVVEVLQ